MTRPLQRAKQLVAKAIDPATTEEEARTVALVAVKLIAQHKMLDELEEVEVAPASPPPWPGPRAAPPDYPPPGYPSPRPAPTDFETFWEQFTDVIGRPGTPFPGVGRQTPGHRQTRSSPFHPFRDVAPSYPGGRPRTHQEAMREGASPWWDRLPCELIIYSERQCEVCRKTCKEGEVVWAYQIVSTIPNLRPRVAHLKDCRDKLPPEHRNPR
jgi:hypothetical protein